MFVSHKLITKSIPFITKTPTVINISIVGGGAGGGYSSDGTIGMGGGGGGEVWNKINDIILNYSTSKTIPIIIGAGGTQNSNGNRTTFGNISLCGGGTADTDSCGSGGGQSYNGRIGLSTGYGKNGNTSSTNGQWTAGGGGGGSGKLTDTKSVGSPGVLVNIGSSFLVCGCGGGGSKTAQGYDIDTSGGGIYPSYSGGIGGDDDGSIGTNAVVNTGSGGGGATRATAGNGSSGIVVISYSNVYDKAIVTGNPEYQLTLTSHFFIFRSSGTITF